MHWIRGTQTQKHGMKRLLIANFPLKSQKIEIKQGFKNWLFWKQSKNDT